MKKLALALPTAVNKAITVFKVIGHRAERKTNVQKGDSRKMKITTLVALVGRTSLLIALRLCPEYSEHMRSYEI